MKICFLLQRRYAYVGHALAELLNKKYNGVLSLKRATTFSTEYRAEEKHLPFEKISFAD